MVTLVCTSANNGDREHPRAEASVDGSGHFDALLSVPLHSSVLRRPLSGRRCLDLYGSYGYEFG